MQAGVGASEPLRVRLARRVDRQKLDPVEAREVADLATIGWREGRQEIGARSRTDLGVGVLMSCDAAMKRRAGAALHLEDALRKTSAPFDRACRPVRIALDHALEDRGQVAQLEQVSEAASPGRRTLSGPGISSSIVSTQSNAESACGPCTISQ